MDILVEPVTQEGRNGGTLKRGNTVGVGRRRNEVRARYLKGCDDSYLIDVAKGKPVVMVPPDSRAGKGAQPTFRYPTHAERDSAKQTCLRYGLGTEDTVKIANGEELREVLIPVMLEFVSADKQGACADALAEAMKNLG